MVRAMPDANRRIEDLAKEFVSQLTAVAREEVMRMLGGSSSGKSKSNGANGSRGEKRSATSLAATQDKVISFIAKHPGLRIEEINRELGTSTKDLALPIRKLLAAKAIKTTGQRRSTKYFAGGKAAKKKTKK